MSESVWVDDFIEDKSKDERADREAAGSYACYESSLLRVVEVADVYRNEVNRALSEALDDTEYDHKLPEALHITRREHRPSGYYRTYYTGNSR